MAGPSIITLIGLILAALTSTVFATEITLTWNRNQEPDIAGYRIYWGRESGNYKNSITIYDTVHKPPVKAYRLGGLMENATYFMAIKSFDMAGQLSMFSDEIRRTTPSGTIHPDPVDPQNDEIILDPPDSRYEWSFEPVILPQIAEQPELCRPFAAGPLKQETVRLNVYLPGFTGWVDIYLGIYAPDIYPDTVFLIVRQDEESYSLLPHNEGFIPWGTGTVFEQETIWGSIPFSSLPPGSYTLYTMVTPHGSTDTYYLWSSTFQVP